MSGASRAWVFNRVAHDEDSRVSEAAQLVYLDKQAQWAKTLRADFLRHKKDVK
jgi:hypothetical protein